MTKSLTVGDGPPIMAAMTIAACYLSAEGVVLGADSTSTVPVMSAQGARPHHLDYAQKIFEIGEKSTLGIASWGLGSLGSTSYRTLVARLADEVQGRAASVLDVAWRWNSLYWSEYSAFIAPMKARLLELEAKGDQRSPDEESERKDLSHNLRAGFCIAGHASRDRRPEAYEITIGPTMTAPQAPEPLPFGLGRLWGWDNILNRLIYGMDNKVFHEILGSGMWHGTPDELAEIVRRNNLIAPMNMPLREAVDWVYSAVYTTIKAIKFSHFDPVCGGPIDVAVVSTDRRFRWVTHKDFDAAITIPITGRRSNDPR